MENYNATDEEIDIQLMGNCYVIDGKLLCYRWKTAML